MKAKLRKAQKALQNTNINSNTSNKSSASKEKTIKENKSQNSSQKIQEAKSNTDNIIMRGLEYDLPEIATYYNFEINKDLIKINENSEYKEKRKEIKELENKLNECNNEYKYILEENNKKNENYKEEINDLENQLKNYISKNGEIIKNENIQLKNEIESLQSQYEDMHNSWQKEMYEMTSLINNVDKSIRNIKGEINFMDDLKYKIYNLNKNEIPTELYDKIHDVFKKDALFADLNKKEEENNKSKNKLIKSVQYKNQKRIVPFIFDYDIDPQPDTKKIYV